MNWFMLAETASFLARRCAAAFGTDGLSQQPEGLSALSRASMAIIAEWGLDRFVRAFEEVAS